jgi:hypothetical protein
MIVAPAIILALILYFIRHSYRHGGGDTSLRNDINYLTREEVEEPIDVESLAFGADDNGANRSAPSGSTETDGS